MEKILKEENISEYLRDYMQKLHYELEGYKSIIKTIITSNGEFSYNKELYENFMNEFKQANLSYRLAMNELLNEIVPEHSNMSNLYCNIDFVKSKVQIIERCRC